MYIPCCPLTETNAEYLTRQREAFWDGKFLTHTLTFSRPCAGNQLTRTPSGVPAPDFPSGEGECDFRGRLTPDYVMDNISIEAQRAMGLAKYDDSVQGLPATERKMLQRANGILGFD